jgi:AraC-like DNA-binding protein
MYLSIALIRAIVDELVRQGFPLPTVCARAGLDAAELADAAARVPIQRGSRVVATAVELSKTPAIGLHVGESAPIGALHIVGHLLYSCATMREAILLFQRYSALVFEGAGFRLVEDSEHGRFVYEHPFAHSPYERFAAETVLTVVLKLGIQLSGSDKRPVEVCFRHEEPSYLDEYQRIFRCPVRFSQPANQLVFERRLLDQPQAHRDDPLCELLRERADELLAHEHDDERLAERIVEVLKLELELGAPDPERLAQRLGLTVRSLQRRLQAEQLSLTVLFDDARRDAACAALRSDSAIKDVAYRLGFSEPSAFHRAFKRWTGLTPAQFRSDARAPRRARRLR